MEKAMKTDGESIDKIVIWVNYTAYRKIDELEDL